MINVIQSMKPSIFFSVIFLLSVIDAFAQINPPGYEREMQAMEERKRTNVLDKDSLTVRDTVILFDPTTEIEEVKVIESTLSWRDYMMFRLGINQPDNLLNGAPLKLTDPKTYEPITVQWNATETKLDTIRIP